jgi:haloalkane dehalogenase
VTVLETDPSALEDLPGFPYEQDTVTVDGYEMAFVDEGEGEETFLCVHGEPTWSYLYRHVIPVLSEVGRVVAPDLVGFGASDKPADDAAHTYDLHARTVTRFVEALDLEDVTVVGQDWGGPFGFHAATRMPDRFTRVVAANTFLPAGDTELPEAWHDFHDFVQRTPDVPVGFLVERGCVNDLPEDVVAAYEAPFPSEEHKAGARRLPELVPRSRDHPAAAPIRETRKRLQGWSGPTYCVFAKQDPIMRPGAEPMSELLGADLDWLDGAGHFIQEDAGEELAEHIVDFVERTPRS